MKRYGSSPERIARNQAQLLRTQKQLDDMAEEKLAAGQMLAASMAQSKDAACGARERLGRYEQRIESSGMRALSMLLKLRQQMSEQPQRQGPMPFLIKENQVADAPSPDESQEMQNEPTAEEPAATDDAAEGCENPSRGTGFQPVLTTCDSPHGLKTRATEKHDPTPAERSG